MGVDVSQERDTAAVHRSVDLLHHASVTLQLLEPCELGLRG